MYCSKCGQFLADNAQFCAHCGTPRISSSSQSLVDSSPQSTGTANRQQMQMGPGGHWYLNGVPVDLPVYTPSTPEPFLTPFNQCSDIDTEEKQDAKVLGYLQDQWQETDDNNQPLQGLISSRFDHLKPTSRPVISYNSADENFDDDEMPIQGEIEIPDDSSGYSHYSSLKNLFSGKSNAEKRQNEDPTFSKFSADGDPDKQEIPLFLLRLVSSGLSFLGALFLISKCIELKTFHMLARMTINGLVGWPVLLTGITLLTGSIFGINSKYSESKTIFSGVFYAISAFLGYFYSTQYIFLTYIWILSALITLLSASYFYVFYVRSVKKARNRF